MHAFRCPLLVNLVLLIGFFVVFRVVDPFTEAGYAPAPWWSFGFDAGAACTLILVGGVAAGLLHKLTPRFLAPLLFAAWSTSLLAFLYVDLLTMYLYLAHLDWSFLALMNEPGILGDLALAPGDVWQPALIVLAVFAFQLSLFPTGTWLQEHGWRLPRCRRVLLVTALVAGATSAWWSAWHHVHAREAREATAPIPLFAPRYMDLGLSRLWSAIGLESHYILVDRELAREAYEQAPETRDYTRFRRDWSPPKGLSAERDWNVLVIAAESWRWDMLTPEIMPGLSRFADDAFTSPAHFSTGTRTPEGLFGLFSGLAPMYWYACRYNDLNTVLFPTLAGLGWKNTVWTSSDLSYGHLDRFVFDEGVDRTFLTNRMKRHDETRVWKRRPLEEEDAEMVDAYLHDLEQRGPGRHLDFLFFYVTHYNYYHPDEFEVFTPSMPSDFSVHDFDLRGKRDRLLNRYKNAAHYLDHLVTRVIDRLRERGELERTIIVITGDHGEEFFERGRFGHSMALNNYQTRVPLILRIPGTPSIRYTVTSHADVAPTVLAALGVNLPIDRTFTGKNLLDHDPERNQAVIMSQMSDGVPLDFALVQDDLKFHFVNQKNDVVIQDVFDMNDAPRTPTQAQRARARESLLSQKRWFSAR